MHIDASAMVAILIGEPERDQFLRRMAEDTFRSTSIVSAFEAVIALARKTDDRWGAADSVREFLTRSNVVIEDAGDSLLEELGAAYAKYGKGSGHPACLNMGDCISYAMAKQAGVSLLYKGNDFSHTDLA